MTEDIEVTVTIKDQKKAKEEDKAAPKPASGPQLLTETMPSPLD